jgi:hypothetical protein
MKPEEFATAEKKLEEQKERLRQYNEVFDDLAKKVLLSGLMLNQCPITSNLRSVELVASCGKVNEAARAIGL